jgi:hypothetical protein
MVMSKAPTAEDYIAELPAERARVLSEVRKVVLKNLPEGYREMMGWGMISYGVPLERYPDTYNGQPLCYAALAAQKNYFSLYLMGVYGHPERERALRDAFAKAGKKLDMGKSCVRFTALDDLPLDAIGRTIAGMPPSELIEAHEAARAQASSRRRSGASAKSASAKTAPAKTASRSSSTKKPKR